MHKFIFRGFNMIKLSTTIALICSFSATSGLSVAHAEEKPLEPWQQAEKTEVWDPVPAIVSVLY
jgi:hypothetical protein